MRHLRRPTVASKGHRGDFYSLVTKAEIPMDASPCNRFSSGQEFRFSVWGKHLFSHAENPSRLDVGDVVFSDVSINLPTDLFFEIRISLRAPGHAVKSN